MDKNYRILKLVSGITIVGDIDFINNVIIVKQPLEVVSRVLSKEGKYVGEQMNFRPFMIMTDEDSVTIDSYNLLVDFSLSTRLHKSYSEMVDMVYKKEITYDGSFISKKEALDKEVQKELEGLSDTTIKELEEFLEEFLLQDTTVH
jgi:hypothetical protein